ncbi:MAG: AraC family transcriptional regulator [Rhodospirillales bacterium]|jgi:AraC-like DNA-binding protein|nr:AraC family transcriptional regulator [Rhodospirillales bacterium]MBT4041383.1 AraC family transcriptional regulator [Rhodospirillales bacterium]MBT4628192.1 AraC family transcriptional regulator [Rhodospirillales bacterium]MBT5351797.1 AraC family transcriptional regulator [Rhodospirillales bacterium]MBT5519957.1 AraC family transcriptional regulator [Rhodospirillales bacterium]
MQADNQDALSDILRLIRLKGCVYFQSDFSSPWGMEMGNSPFAQYHVVIRGQCWLVLDGERHLLSSGDVVLIPDGDAHTLQDDPETETIPGLEVLSSIQSGTQPFQEGEETVRLLCGHFEFDRTMNHPFVRDLPRLIHIKGMGNKQPNWIEGIAPVLVGKSGGEQLGTETIVERLAEVLLIQVIREYLLEQSEEHGFLAALGDKRINNALKVIHVRANHDLTLSDIAKEVGMSRSGLAARFKELVGDTPMNYLTTWRMLRAKDILKSATMPMMEVAESVGYASEAAFSRAFKREHKITPSAYRHSVAHIAGA